MGDSGDNGGGRYWNPNWMVDHGKFADLTRAELLVYQYQARWCNADGECYRGVDRIARDMKLSDRSVQRALRGLVGQGMITALSDSKGGRERTVNYKLLSHTWKKYQGKGD